MTAIIGIDEVGTGAWAGPITLCAFLCLDAAWGLDGLDDSKALTATKRARLFEPLSREPHGFGQATHREIDTVGAAPAYQLALMRALQALEQNHGAIDPSIRILIDGNPFHFRSKYQRQVTFIPQGDKMMICIQAASVLAKVHRDRQMVELAKTYPHWGFDNHKGYGTPEHTQALLDHGISAIHRTSVRPVQAFLSSKKAG